MIKLLFRLVFVLLIGAGLLLLFGGGSPEASRADTLAQLTRFTTLLEDDDVRVEEISGWSVRQHAEHVLLANEGILGLIEAGMPPEEIEPKSILGRFVLAAGMIPRGRGEAPSNTEPSGLSQSQLATRLAATFERTRAIDPVAAGASETIVGNHPYFGGFTSSEWLRLMSIHTGHHLAIVEELLLAEDASASAD